MGPGLSPERVKQLHNRTKTGDKVTTEMIKREAPGIDLDMQ